MRNRQLLGSCKHADQTHFAHRAGRASSSFYGISSEASGPFHSKGDAVPLAEETAVYSRCDQNHHLNNTAYADILTDHLPQELLLERQLSRLSIVYHKEVPMGHSFQLSRAQLRENDYYFVGQSDTGSIRSSIYIQVTKLSQIITK